MNQNNSIHVENKLALYLMNELDTEECNCIIQHLSDCTSCHKKYDIIKNRFHQLEKYKPTEPDTFLWTSIASSTYQEWYGNKNSYNRFNLFNWVVQFSSPIHLRFVSGLATIGVVIGLSVLFSGPNHDSLSAFRITMPQLEHIETTSTKSNPYIFNNIILGFSVSETSPINSYTIGYSIANSIINCHRENSNNCQSSLHILKTMLKKQNLLSNKEFTIEDPKLQNKSTREDVISVVYMLDHLFVKKLDSKNAFIYSLGAWVRTSQLTIQTDIANIDDEVRVINKYLRKSQRYNVPKGITESLTKIKSILNEKYATLNEIEPEIKNIHSLFM